MSKESVEKAAGEIIEMIEPSGKTPCKGAMDPVVDIINREVDRERERCIEILKEHFRYDWHSQFDDAVKEMREAPE